jgi:hypothetical protein
MSARSVARRKARQTKARNRWPRNEKAQIPGSYRKSGLGVAQNFDVCLSRSWVPLLALGAHDI